MKFTYYMPTRVLVGAGCVAEHSQYLCSLGQRAFLMTGKYSAAANGSLADMCAALDKEGIRWQHWNQVGPNPTLEEVRLAAAAARDFGADCIIALGGGSPMDAAKAVAVLAAGEVAVSDEVLLSQRRFVKVLPLAVVPTTAGTGSEVTPYAILTNNTLKTKSFLTSEQVYPKLAFLDGRYTLDLPLKITAATAVDAMSHAIEGYLAVRATPPGQSFALESLRLLGPQLSALAAGQTLDLAGRETLLYASMLAGIVISQSGTTAVHAMGYSLTYFKEVDHGKANGVLMAAYLRYLTPARPQEISTLLSALGQANIDSLALTLEKLIGRVQLNPDEIDRFAGIAIQAANIQNTRPQPAQEDLKTMLGNSCKK